MSFSQISHIKAYGAGLCLSLMIGLSALFLSSQYGASAMLMALLLGLSFHFLSHNKRYDKGLAFSAKKLLRIAVALLGLRISLAQILDLGWLPLIIVILAVLTTLGFGVCLAKAMGYDYKFGALTGGAVAICGASAAMAISAVMPPSEPNKKDTVFAIIGVTTLSTLAMVIYPLLVIKLGLNDQQAGLFLGGSIHDVAQVTGAGYGLSPQIGDMSVFFKLLRVAMLAPIVLAIRFFVNRDAVASGGNKAKITMPFFLIAFILLFLLNNIAPLPQGFIDFTKFLSSLFLLMAVAALGVQTSLKEITKLGLRPIILMASETLFIAVFILGFIWLSW